MRKWPLLTLILSLGSSGALHANPLDSPGVVYIDGLPCNRACQSYMAWSDQALAARHSGQRKTVVVVPAEPETAGPEHASPARVTRQGAAAFRAVPRAGMAASKTKPSSAKKAAPSLAAASKNLPSATPPVVREKTVAGGQSPERKVEIPEGPAPSQAGAIAAQQPAATAKSEVTSEAKSEVKSEVSLPPPATLELAAAPAVSENVATPAAPASAPASSTRTIQQQVVEATGMADLVTAIGTSREATSNLDNPEIEPDHDAAKTASADEPDNLVALVLARPEINSLSDLNNKSIAIEEKQSASSGRVSAAFMAAGAAEVQFSEGQRGAIDRLISGEVPAAVLTLASREAAEWFPDIEGFRIFRVPLKARL
jgi:hypothetical protein